MRRFTKVCLLTALVFAVLGIGCFIVGAILGASPIRAFEEAFLYEDNYGKDFDESWDLEDFTLEKECKAASVQSLSVNMDMGCVVVKTVSSDACRVWADGGNYTKSFSVTADEDGVLRIEEESYHRCSFADFALYLKGKILRKGTRVIIELPQEGCQAVRGDIQFGSMKVYDLKTERMFVDVEAGSIYSVGMINTNHAELSVGMGSAAIDRLECSQAVICADMGDVNVRSVTADTLDVDADMGNISFSRIKAGKLTADCSMGNINLELVGKPEDYDISYDVDMGEVDLDGYTGSRRHAESARYTAELNCDMGNIDVSFLGYDE